MALPKRRHSKARRDRRRTHDKLKQPTSVVCPNCQEMKLPHHVCMSCGFYDGRQVLNVDEESKRWGIERKE